MLTGLITYFTFILLALPFSNEHVTSNCTRTPEGPAIDWSPEVQLTWSDFKGRFKPNKGFAVAASTCGFGYNGIISGSDISINVYVRFYCNESWRHKKYQLDEVLEHEQLHFDICELYGRLLYKEILSLRKRGKLNERSLDDTLKKLRIEYDATQDAYDRETNHSMNTDNQENWNRIIRKALDQHQAYANYKEF